MQHRTRTTLTVLGLLLAGAGCLEPPADDELATTSHALYVDSTAIWASTSIPVCWETAGNDTEKGWVRAAIKRTWELQTGLVFEGWSACSAGAPGIHIRVANEWPRSGVGNELDGVSNGMTLNFVFSYVHTDGTQPFGSCMGADRQRCIEVIGVHEFGHAIGFAHEQNRADTPASCTEPDDGYGDTPVGDWDATSIMNYCNPTWNNAGKLSTGDVAGARRYYGYPAAQDQQFLIADVTGDQRSDIIQNWRGWGSIPYCKAVAVNTFVNLACSNYQAAIYNSGSPGQVSLAADFDGDGKADLAQLYRGFGSIPRCLSTGAGWTCSNPQAAVYDAGTHEQRYLTGRFHHGDSKSGIVQVHRGWGSIPLCESTAAGWSCGNSPASIHDSGSREQEFLTADINRDGLTDILQTYRGWGSIPACLATGDGQWYCENFQAAIHDSGSAEQRFLTGDVNRDGMTDVLQVYRGWSSIPVCTVDEVGHWTCSNPSAVIHDSGSHEQQFLTGDFNRDGRTDVFQTYRGWGSIPVCLATASGGWDCSNLPAAIKNSGSPEQRFVTADINKDGRTDIVQVHRGFSKYPVCLSTGTSWDCREMSSTIYDAGY